MDLEKIQDLSERDLKRFITQIELRNTRLKFAKDYHVNTDGNKLSFDKRFKYLNEIYNTTAPKLVLASGTQLGKSDFLVVDALACSYLGLSAMMCFPKQDFRSRFVKEKIKRPLGISPEYCKILKESFSDTVELINFGKGLISFVSAHAEADFTSYSAHVYYVEELDQAEPLENVQLGFARLDGSDYGFWRLVANPTSTADGRIWDWYKRSDMRVWECPCDNCGEFSELDWFKTVVKEILDEDGSVISYERRDKDWVPGGMKDLRAVCPICEAGYLDRDSEDSRWRATAYSEEGITGYHMPSIISTLHDVGKLWQEFKNSLDNQTALAKFFSTKLALPFSYIGSNISVNLLQNCSRKGHKFIVPNRQEAYVSETHEGPCSMGIDQNSTNFDVRISCVGQGMKRESVYLGKFPIEEDYRIDELVERYNVAICAMDNEPNVPLTLKLQERLPCEFWRFKYKTTTKHSERTDNHNIMLISIHRTEALDRRYTQLKTRKNVLPENFEDIFGGTYADEMKDLKKVISEDKNGETLHSWSFSQKDHHAHADAMDLVVWDSLASDTLLGKDTLYIG